MRIKPGIYLVLFILGFSFTIMPQAAAAPSLQEQKTLEYISEMDSDLYRALPAIRTKSVADYNAILEVYKTRIEKIKEVKDIVSYDKIKAVSKEVLPEAEKSVFDEKKVLDFIAKNYPIIFKNLEEMRKTDLKGYWHTVISNNKTMKLLDANRKAAPILFGLIQSDKDFANQEAILFSKYLKGTVKRAEVQKQLFELAYPLARKNYTLADLSKLLNLEIEDRINKWDNLKKIAERR
jgi:hypothetical protein